MIRRANGELRGNVMEALRENWERDGYIVVRRFLEEGYLDGLSQAGRAFFGRFVEQYREDWRKKRAG
jgi:hypothetical protein